MAEHPRFCVALETKDTSHVINSIAQKLGTSMKVAIDGNTVDARSGDYFTWGSPALHWALVALVVTVGIGRLTRAEGYIGIPQGKRVSEVHGSYLSVEEGRLFGERHTGLGFVLSDVNRNFSENGVPFGIAPLISIYRGNQLIARQWVHANKPLRVGALMVHMKELGPALVLQSEERGIGATGRETFLLKRETASPSGTSAQVTTVSRMSGEPVEIRVQVRVRRVGEDPRSPSRAIVETTTVGGSVGQPHIVVKGSSLEVAPGLSVRVVDVRDWVRVSVVNDWSVPVVYGLLVFAILGLAVAVILPTRRVSFLLLDTDAGPRIHATVWHSRQDGLFEERVLKILHELAEGRGQE